MSKYLDYFQQFYCYFTSKMFILYVFYFWPCIKNPNNQTQLYGLSSALNFFGCSSCQISRLRSYAYLGCEFYNDMFSKPQSKILIESKQQRFNLYNPWALYHQLIYFNKRIYKIYPSVEYRNLFIYLCLNQSLKIK